MSVAGRGNASRGSTPSGSSPGGRGIPTRSDLATLLSSDHGPVNALPDARKWLEGKGWSLQGEAFNRSKLVNILLTASLFPKVPADVAAAIRAVAFLLEDNITDNISTALADAVAAKVKSQLEGFSSELSSNINFLRANTTQQAATSVDLKETATLHATTASTLAEISTKLASNTPLPRDNPQWPSIQETQPRPPPSSLPSPSYDPAAPPQHTLLRQRLLQAARTILIEVDPASPTAPKDRSQKANYNLREEMNKHLARLDKLENEFQFDDSAPTIKTSIRGIQALERGAYRIDFDSSDSATRFKEYASDEESAFLTRYFGSTAIIKPKAIISCSSLFPVRLASIQRTKPISPKSKQTTTSALVQSSPPPG